jgi:nucleotide-binding universal stress UspA family protein
MFKHIMVPVDLSVKETLSKAVNVAADLARLYGAKITFVSVSGGLQADGLHSDEKYGRLLAEFAAEQSQAKGVRIDSLNVSVPDPSVEVDATLRKVITEIAADLVVIASHQPGWIEYILASHGGKLAAHAPISVFVVREEDG